MFAQHPQIIIKVGFADVHLGALHIYHPHTWQNVFSTSSAHIKEGLCTPPSDSTVWTWIWTLSHSSGSKRFCVCVIVAGTLLKTTTVKLAILCPSLVIQNMGNRYFLWSTNLRSTCPVLALIGQDTATVILPLMLLGVFFKWFFFLFWIAVSFKECYHS